MKTYHFLLTLLLFTAACVVNAKEPENYTYQRGVEALKDGETEKGLELLNNDLSEHPKNGYAYVWIAAAHGTQGEVGKALSAVNHAMQYIPKSDKVYRAWAHKIRGLVELELGDTTAAIADYTQAIKLYPEYSDYYGIRGNLYFELHQYDLSNADYKRLIQLEPGNTDGYMGYGRNLSAQEKFDEAILQFSMAAKLDSKFSQALAFRGECYLKQKNYELGLSDYIKAIEMDDNPKASYELTHVDKDGFDIAAAQLKLQMAKNPSATNWLIYSGLLYENQKMYKKAIAIFEKAKTLDADIWYDREIADCYYAMGDFANALRSLKTVYDADSTNSTVLMLIANAYNECDSVDAAIRWATKAIELSPDQKTWYYRRGWYADKADRWDEAIEDYTMALTVDPDYTYALLCRGQLYRLQGKADLAKKDFERVIVSEPIPHDDGCAQYAYFYLGDTAKAIALMDSILAKYPDNEYDAACIYSLIGDTATSLVHLRKAFENGFRRFAHLRKDDDIANTRESAGYKALYEEYWQQYQSELEQGGEKLGELEEVTYEIPFTAANGITKVDCTINGLPLNFYFDTGASDVSISQTEANFMFKNGYLSQKDIVGRERYGSADGSIHVGTIIILNKINFGGVELTNVRASVVANQRAPLLLGQTVLQRLGKIEIDNERKVLKITTKK